MSLQKKNHKNNFFISAFALSGIEVILLVLMTH